MKLLLVDTELSFALYYAFPSKKPQYLPARQVKEHQSIVCARWKWFGEKKVGGVSVLDDPARFRKNHRDDYIVAVKLHKAFMEADVICAHNGDSFDIKHANTLFIKHNLEPVPEKKSLDTLKIARRYFNFTGNGLDDLLKFFGYPGKSEKPDWIKLTEGDEKEIRKAMKYCGNDVLGLERLLKIFLPYIPKHKALVSKGPCVECGSKHIQKKGQDFDGTRIYQRVKCMNCGHNDKREVE